MMTEKDKEIFTKRSLQAIYHNCMAQSHFSMADAMNDDSNLVCYGRERESQAYQIVAVWINELIKKI